MSELAKAHNVEGERPPPSRERIGPLVRKTLRKPQFWFGASVLVPTFVWYWVFGFGPNSPRILAVGYQIPAAQPIR